MSSVIELQVPGLAEGVRCWAPLVGPPFGGLRVLVVSDVMGYFQAWRLHNGFDGFEVTGFTRVAHLRAGNDTKKVYSKIRH